MNRYNQQEFCEYLLRQSKAPEASLSSLMQQAEELGQRFFLGDLLIESGLMSEEQLRDCVADFLGVGSIILSEETFKPAPELLCILPEEVVEVFRVLPVRMDDDALYVAGELIFFLPYLQSLRSYVPNKHIEPLVATRGDVAWALKQFYNIEEDRRGSLFVQAIIADALSKRATDIHFESAQSRLIIRYRIDKKLEAQNPIPSEYSSQVVRAIKDLSRLDSVITQKPQQGQFVVDTGSDQFTVTVSTLPTIHGESIVLHVAKG